MRKALLLVKIALVLAAFASLGSTHAAASDHHNLVTQAGDLVFSSVNPGGDDKKAVNTSSLIVLPDFLHCDSPSRPAFVFTGTFTTRPFARAPPAIPFV